MITTNIRPTMNSFKTCLLLSVILQIATSQTTPSIIFISPKQTRDVGGTVELQCSTINVTDVPVLWTKLGEQTLFISVGNSLVIPDNRYFVKRNHTSSTTTLKIQYLGLEDSGLYQCVLLIARDNRITADVELQVRQIAASDN